MSKRCVKSAPDFGVCIKNTCMNVHSHKPVSYFLVLIVKKVEETIKEYL